MNANTVEALVALNRAFYDRFAGDFARTRRSSPPGFDRIVPYLLPAANVIDLGCGSGRLLRYLAGHAWRGRYVGLDASTGLLDEARRAATITQIDANFEFADLMEPVWPVKACSLARGDAVVSLAVLHHIPSAANRARFMAQAAQLVPPAGHLVVSSWQFLTSDRLRKRLLPWSTVGLREDEVEPGDYLMSWGEGAAGRRYVAAIAETELSAFAASAGLDVVELFSTDGLEGDLNLYGVFAPH